LFQRVEKYREPTKHTLRSSLVKSDQKEIHSRWHRWHIAFPVMVAEATLAKQADL
jgi:hypothetical protein